LTYRGLFAALVGLASCAASSIDPVSALLAERQERDGQRVNVEGVIGIDQHGLANLYSRDRGECVGLLITDQQRRHLASLEGRIAVVSGVIRAEGCGRDSFCDEHLCGPAILTDMTAE
jgi:hypothetical protein